MENFRRHLGWAVLVSELGHVFCCVLPTVFTVLSFAANIGLIGMAPSWLMALHEHIHHYELPIIAFSGAVLVLGWAALLYSGHVDCHDTGCGHTPCHAGKDKNKIIMIIATVLFTTNFFIYAVIHKNVFHIAAFEHAVEDHDHEHPEEGTSH